jgi:hypothetical protein
MVSLPMRLYSMLIGGLLAVVMVAMIGDYALTLTGHTPGPTGGNLAHVALGGLIGLLVVPSGSGETKKPDAN